MCHFNPLPEPSCWHPTRRRARAVPARGCSLRLLEHLDPSACGHALWNPVWVGEGRPRQVVEPLDLRDFLEFAGIE